MAIIFVIIINTWSIGSKLELDGTSLSLWGLGPNLLNEFSLSYILYNLLFINLTSHNW